jgi:DNA-binding GntR family transcriptional regulator
MPPDSVCSVDDLDKDSPVPLWRQMADGLRKDIGPGVLSGKLPAGQVLAKRYEVSRDTLRHAIAVLTDEGLMVAVRGKGSCVARKGAGQ